MTGLGSRSHVGAVRSWSGHHRPGRVGLSGVRLVATDLDGTLLDAASQVSARATDAVAAARSAGIHVVPATGRPPQGLWHIAEAGGLGPIGICSNGAAVVDLEAGKVIEVDPLTGPVARRVVQLARAVIPGVRFALDDLERFSFEPSFLPEGSDWDDRISEVADIEPYAAEGCVKLIVRHPGTDAVTLMGRLQEAVGTQAQVTTSGLDWAEIMAPGVSKASALDRVCRRLGIHPGEVVAIGDNYNDLSALDWAGHPMAPANAVDAVLDVVCRVLPRNTDDGVALLLEELVRLRA